MIMENFIYDIPTSVYFGKGQIEALKELIPTYGSRILLVYGGGSIKKSGVYNQVIEVLLTSNVEIYELAGVEANPRIETVRKGVQVCEQHQIEVVLPIGGGSVIDCAKAIAASYGSKTDAWELIEDSRKVQSVLPIVCVLTLAATGSEMDAIAVVSDIEKREKRPLKHPFLRPKVAIMDPTYTYSVPKKQTAAGIVDILSHLMETYFSNSEGYMQERICEALMKTCMHCGYQAFMTPYDYEARANLMWTSSWAINDFLKCGRPVTWSVHAIEHQLSACYDLTHGVGLAILTPHWMEHVLNEQTELPFARFARLVFGVEDEQNDVAARKGMQCLKAFYQTIDMPSTLRDVGITTTTLFDEMSEKALPYLKDTFFPLTKEDIIAIYERSF